MFMWLSGSLLIGPIAPGCDQAHDRSLRDCRPGAAHADAERQKISSRLPLPCWSAAPDWRRALMARVPLKEYREYIRAFQRAL